ncbi:hypothetical protein BJQ89_03254 [Arthrobacter sp. ES1]|nr:hypothetical protein [Arthrobacter sp. ES1]
MGAQTAGVFELFLERVHGDDPRDPLRNRGDQRGHTNASEPHDHHTVLRPGPGRVQHRTAAGQHGAAEDGGDVRRDVIIDRDGRGAVHNGVGGEAGDAQVVVDLFAAAAQPHRSVQEGTFAVAPGTSGAGEPPIFPAIRAPFAAGQEGHHNTLAGRQVLDLRADLDDASRSLMPQQHRHRAHPVPVHNAQIRVADAGGFDLHQDLGGPRTVQLQLGDGDGLGVSERAGAPDFLEYSTGDLHCSLSVGSLQRVDMSWR